MQPLRTYLLRGVDEIAKELRSSKSAGLSGYAIKQAKKEWGRNYPSLMSLWGLLQFGLSPLLPAFLLLIPLVAIATPEALFPLLSIFIVSELWSLTTRHSPLRAVLINTWNLWSTSWTKTMAIRGRKSVQLRGYGIATGDIVLLQEGMLIPADMKIIEADDLQVDESRLFGITSSSRTKEPYEPMASQDLRQARSLLFAGSTITKGACKAIVISVGKKRLIHTLFDVVDSLPLLYKQLLLIRWIAMGLVAIGLAILPFSQALAATYTIHLLYYLPVLLGVQVLAPLIPRSSSPLLENSATVLLPLEETVAPRSPLSSSIYVNRTVVELHDSAETKEQVELLGQFLDLFSLTLPHDQILPINRYLDEIKHFLTVHHGASFSRPAGYVLDPSSVMYEQDSTGTQLFSYAVYEHPEGELPPLKITQAHPSHLIQGATYIWDAQMNQGRRRFFPQEKTKLTKLIEELEAEGAIVYGLATQEEERTEKGTAKRMVFIGFIAIPTEVSSSYLSFIEQCQSVKKQVILYSQYAWNKTFLREKLGLTEESVFSMELVDNRIPTYTKLEGKPLLLVERAIASSISKSFQRHSKIPATRMSAHVIEEHAKGYLPPLGLRGTFHAKDLQSLLSFAPHFSRLIRKNIRYSIAAALLFGLLGLLYQNVTTYLAALPLLLAPALYLLAQSFLPYIGSLKRQEGSLRYPPNKENYISPLALLSLSLWWDVILLAIGAVLLTGVGVSIFSMQSGLPMTLIVAEYPLVVFMLFTSGILASTMVRGKFVTLLEMWSSIGIHTAVVGLVCLYSFLSGPLPEKPELALMLVLASTCGAYLYKVLIPTTHTLSVERSEKTQKLL